MADRARQMVGIKPWLGGHRGMYQNKLWLRTHRVPVCTGAGQDTVTYICATSPRGIAETTGSLVHGHALVVRLVSFKNDLVIILKKMYEF